jgi:predicted nucleotidyltransferase component of viral defense system
MSNEWYNIPKQTKINAYTQISESTGMAPYAVEKDWWVVQVLSALFELKVGKHMIFKGGTSLSKAWILMGSFQELR